MNYPEAWEICKSVPEEQHHPDCSWRSGLLCDCEVLVTHPRHIEDYPDIKPDWKTYGKWVDGKWQYNKGEDNE